MEEAYRVPIDTHIQNVSVFKAPRHAALTSGIRDVAAPSLSARTKPSLLPQAIVTLTLNQSLVPVPTNFASVTTTLSGTPAPLLTTANCVTPYFASIRDPAGNPLLYPQIGCSFWYPDCCPFGWEEGVVLDHCAGNYTTQVLGTHSACCPVGDFTLYSSAIGLTPCASKLTGTVYVPATTLTERNTRLQTEYLFAYSLPLAERHRPSRIRVVVPIVVVLLILLAVGVGILVWKRKQLRRPKPPSLAMSEITSPRPTSHRPVDQPGHLAAPQPPAAPLIAHLTPVSPRPPVHDFSDTLPPDPAEPPPYVPKDAVELEAGEHHPACRPYSGLAVSTVGRDENRGHTVSPIMEPSPTASLVPSPLLARPRHKPGFI